jgi:S1/P1 Nuclease
LDECFDDATECALEWAEEANKWVCQYVLKDDVAGLQGRDLGGSYHDGATEIIDEMIRKGGRRLAKWVNVMAEKWWEEQDGHETGEILEVQEL